MRRARSAVLAARLRPVRRPTPAGLGRRPSTTSAWWSRASSGSARASSDVVVARVREIAAIEGADRIRLVRRRRRRRRRSRSSAAPGTSRVGDLVPLAPVGTVLPGGFEIGRRKMQGRRLERHALLGPRARRSPTTATGCCVLTEVDGADPGLPVAEAARASSPTSSSTSPSRATGPTPGAWPASPATWRPGSASPFALPDPAPGAGRRRTGGRRSWRALAVEDPGPAARASPSGCCRR